MRPDIEIKQDIKLALTENDQEAYSRLYLDISALASRMSFRIFRRIDEDYVQDTTSHILMRLHLFYGKSKFFSWGYRICLNLAIMGIRKNKDRLISIDEFEPYLYDTRVSFRIINLRIDYKTLLERSGLSPYNRDIFSDYMIGLRVKELSSKYGIPSTTMKNRIHRIKTSLRRLYENSRG